MEHLLGRSKVEPRVKLVDHWAVTAVGEVMCAAKGLLGRGGGGENEECAEEVNI